MRIIVQWEDSREIEYVHNLVEVLAKIAPSLAVNARVNGDEVTWNHATNSGLPRVLVRPEPDYEAMLGLVDRRHT